MIWREMVTQQPNQTSPGRAYALYYALRFQALAPPRRQRSEQYRTSSQQRSHALRQVISRPQAWHGLLGRYDLLPAKLLLAPDEDLALPELRRGELITAESRHQLVLKWDEPR